MSIASTIKDNVALLGQGELSIGRAGMPAVIQLDITDILKKADVFVGHIGDKIKNGEDCIFAVSDQNLICAALVLASDLRATDVERELLTSDLIGHAVDNESLVDVQAVVKAISDAAESLTTKFQDFRLYDDDLLNYVFSRFINGQLELVRKSVDDPNASAASRGFTIPAWTTSDLKR